MPKDAAYHESAIRYNQEIAQFAEDLAPTLEDEEVQRWSRAVAKQHRFHEGRHKKALSKLSQDQEAIEPVTPGPIMDEIDIVDSDPSTYSEGFGEEQNRDSVPTDVETSETPEELDARIDALHGEGAAAALDAAIADGSVFGESEMDSEAILETGIIDSDLVMDPEVESEEKNETELCESGFPRSMPVSYPTGQCSNGCLGGHPATEEKE